MSWLADQVLYRAKLWDELALNAKWLAHVQAMLDDLVVLASQDRRTILFAGNGGSAADAQHLAAEYVGTGLAALALTTDTSALTALGNDFGYEEVFARQVAAVGRRGDILVMHSTSGDSENLVRAATVARDLAMVTVGLTARGGGKLARAVHYSLVVPTDDTQLAQEVHLAVGHAMWQRVLTESLRRRHGQPQRSGPN